MTTDVSISSNALLSLGGKPFSDFSENRDHVTLCANLFPGVRDSILRAHPWKCATSRVILSPLVDTPPFDFKYQYALPGDWLRNVQVGYKGCTIPFRAEGRRILSNSANLPLVYVFRNDQPATWSTNLIELMEFAMAARICYPVTTSTTLRDSMNAELDRKLKIAKAVDGQDDPPEEFEEGSFVESRFG